MSVLAPTVLLRNGAQMPVLGLGTWPLRESESATQVRTAIEAGYRLIDTAENYRNEDAVGQGIRDSGIERSEVFVATKFDREWHSVDGVRRSYEAGLKRLGIDYIDLLMVHWPNPSYGRYVDAMLGLEAALKETGLRAIGTSNFKPSHLQRVLDETGIVPDVNQIELSPYTTRNRVMDSGRWVANCRAPDRPGDHRDRKNPCEIRDAGCAPLAHTAGSSCHTSVGRSRSHRRKH